MTDFGNTDVFNQSDALNNGVVQPFWRGNQAANLIDESGQSLQGAVTREWYRSNVTLTSTGAANAYTVTYEVSPSALYQGQKFNFIANHTSTGAATLTVNLFAPVAIKKAVSGVLVDVGPGDLTVNHSVEAYYNGTVFVLVVGFGSGTGYVAATSKAAIQTLNPGATPYVDYVTDLDSDGFVWKAGDYAARITADPQQGRYIGSSVPGFGPTIGAYVRRTDQEFSPRFFDCRSGSGLDDTTRLQRYFDVLTNERIDNADWSGEYSTLGPITFGPSSGDCLTKEIQGRMKLSALTGSTGVSMFKAQFNDNLRLGSLELKGIGGAAYSGRATGYAHGLDLNDCSRLLMDGLIASAVYGYAVSQPNTPAAGENNNFNQITRLKAFDCGSGQGGPTYTGTLTGAYSNIVNTSLGTSLNQTGKFDATVLPPVNVTDLSNVISPCFVTMNGRLYTILSVDRVASPNTITVFPCIDTTLSTGTYGLVFGGAALTQNGDSNMLMTRLLDATRCGIALADGALYGATDVVMNATSCGIGLLIGASQSTAISGGFVKGYFEGNEADIILHTRAVLANANYTVTGEHTLDLVKIPNIRNARLANNKMHTSVSAMHNLSITYNGKALTNQGAAENNDDIAGTWIINFTDPVRRKVISNNTAVFNIAAPELGLNTVTGIDDYAVVVMTDAAAGGIPTSATFNKPVNNTFVATADATSDKLSTTASVYYMTGTRVQFTTTGTLPGGLSLVTDYYLIRFDDGTYKVALSVVNADAGTAIDLTSAGTGTLTVQVPFLVNNSASAVVFSGLTKNTEFQIKHRVKENNFIVVAL